MSDGKIKILTYIKENVSWFDASLGVLRWLKNGLLHREDGPAFQESGDDTYVLNGFEYASKSTWRRALKRLWEKQGKNYFH